MSTSSQSVCRSLVALRRAHGERAHICWRHLLLIATIAFAGCRTANYTAAKLPTRLDVPSVPKTTGINLAQMAGRGAGTSEIANGDLVELTIASGLGEERVEPAPARVAHDGTVLVPLVGPVQVGGLEPYTAEQRIAAAAVERGVFRQPYVTIQVAERAVNRVTVLGAVAQPGVVELPRGASDLVNALAAAGGLSDEAGTEVDVLRHDTGTYMASQPGAPTSSPDEGVRLASYTSGAEPAPIGFSPPPLAGEQRPTISPQTARIDLANMEQVIGSSYELADRDVVMVLPEEKRVIHVTGLVQKPDRFEASPKRDVRVLDAIAMAGGIKSPLADKVFVIRQLPDMPEPAVIKVSISRAKRNGHENLRLTAGDLVSVETTPATMVFDTASTLMRTTIGIGGNFAAF